MAARKRKSVNRKMIKEAVAALSERNGSTVKMIFDFLVKTNKVRSSSRAQVVLSIRRAVKSGLLVKKLPNTFMIPAGKVSSKTSFKKRRARRMKKKSAPKTTKRRRRGGKKRKQLKKKSMKKRGRVARRKMQKKRSRKSPKVAAKVAKPSLTKTLYTGRPKRKCAQGIRYSA